MIRQPAVSGRFYQGEKNHLLAQIEACFSHKLGIGKEIPAIAGRLQALISPHAGFMFSGPPASFGFARLKQEQTLPQRIILIGPKHTHYGANYAVSGADYWETPLGKVQVDKEFCQKICSRESGFILDDAAHQLEHSLEVQLPFLQFIYGDAQLKIVPIAIGYNSFADLTDHAEKFARILKFEDTSHTLFIVSSDFSHDTPRELAYRLDAEVIENILGLSPELFYNQVVSEDRSVCGVMPITFLLLLLSKMKTKARLLKYSTSMDVMEHDRGVGYASIIFEEAK